MKNLIPLMVLVLVFLMGCEKEEVNELVLADDTIAYQDNYSKSAARKSKPFKGTIAYTPNANSIDCECPPGTEGEFTGSGNLTHLGLTISETDVCNAPPQCGAFPNFGFTVSYQCVVFTAANGDELYAYAEESYGVCGEFPNPILSGEVVILFDGGTGRFEDASGQADVEIIVTLNENFGTESVSSKFNGEINY